MRPLLTELLTLHSEVTPFLSVYLDTRPAEARLREGHRQRNSLVWLNHRLSELDSEVPPRGPIRDGFDRDLGRLQVWLRDELQPATQGAAIFACHSLGVFRTLQVPTPFDNRAVLGKEPFVYPLARLLDEDRAYLAIVVNSTRARLYQVVLGRIAAAQTLEHDLERLPERDAGPGAPSARGHGGIFGATELSYQRYLEQQVRHHLKEVADRAREMVDRERLRHVVLAGDRQVSAELFRLLPKAVQERVIDTLALDPNSADHVVLRESLQALERRAADEAARKVEWLVDGHLTGGLGIMGLRSTVEALNRSQVDELVLSDSFAASGWVCPGCSQILTSVTAEGNCPYCEGKADRQDDLREPMVRQADRTGARIEVVEANPDLDQREGVGALLRYRAAVEPYPVG